MGIQKVEVLHNLEVLEKKLKLRHAIPTDRN